MIDERNSSGTKTGPGDERPDDGEEALAALMSLAGSRREIPPAVEQRVRAGVETEWRRATAVRRTVRWAAPLALAASVVLAIAIGVNMPEPVSAPVGTIARASGATGLSEGDVVYAGDTLETAASGGISFALRDDTSVRLAPGSALRIEAEDEYTLLAGAVYVDTGERIYRDRRLAIATDFGSVTDVGTQFAVRLADSRMRVAVREGRVDIATGEAVVAAEAGMQVSVDAAARTSNELIKPTDDEWSWAEVLAPRFDIEGRSVLEFLKWVARETGMELEFRQPDDRQAAMSSTLHGSINDLTPMEALASVMPTTNFEYVIDGDAISVRR